MTYCIKLISITSNICPLLQGVVIDKAAIQAQYRTCRNGVVHRIDQVLLPPPGPLVRLVFDDPNLRSTYISLRLKFAA